MNQTYIIDPLFDFQSICDIDYGLYNLIKEDYYDKSIFDNYLFDSNDIRFIKTMLLSRFYFNPLYIFCNKDSLTKKEMDDLYKEFLDKEYNKIIDYSIPTSFMDIASISNMTNKLVDVTILCRNQKEVEWVNKYNYKLKCIIHDYNNFNLKKYDTLYIKDIYTLELFDQVSLKNKNIILPRFRFNLEDYSKMDMPLMEISKKYYKDNKFILADPYKDIMVPVNDNHKEDI